MRSRLEARKKILENKNEVDAIKIQNHIFFGEEIRDFLEKNIA
jgi:complex III assembly factor LYRM7